VLERLANSHQQREREKRKLNIFSLLFLFIFNQSLLTSLSLSAFFFMNIDILIVINTFISNYAIYRRITNTCCLFSLSYPRIRSYQVNEKIYNNILYWLIYINHSNHVLTLTYSFDRLFYSLSNEDIIFTSIYFNQFKWTMAVSSIYILSNTFINVRDTGH